MGIGRLKAMYEGKKNSGAWETHNPQSSKKNSNAQSLVGEAGLDRVLALVLSDFNDAPPASQ
jgi:hypothetical protein